MNYNTYKEYQKAFSEIKYIIDNLEEEIKNKIPDKFKEFIVKNMDKTYKVKMPLEYGLDKCKLSNKTKEILSLIYRDYLCLDK